MNRATPNEADRYCYANARPALTVDVVALRPLAYPESGSYEILLIQRGHAPFKGSWALPGGFIELGERPKEAARRELFEETGVQVGSLRQVGAFADPNRDPRGWVVSIAYVCEIAATKAPTTLATAGDDAAAARWWAVSDLPALAFDHKQIIDCALVRSAGSV